MTRTLTYCSFATESQCIGICILFGKFDAVEASLRARDLGIHPGPSELLTMVVEEGDPDVPPDLFEVMWVYGDKCMSPDAARILFDASSIRELESALPN